MKIHLNSEIGKLEGVIIHTPGPEVENMTPQNAERALYSDILNLSIVRAEYQQFSAILRKVSKTFEVRQLLEEVLAVSTARDNLTNEICTNEQIHKLRDTLNALSAAELAKQLIEGVPLKKNTLTDFLSPERYKLQPLHNFFFTRDTGIAINEDIFISRLSTAVRDREALIMDIIFRYHPEFRCETVNPMHTSAQKRIYLEGGDFLIIREDVLVIGIGSRTSSQGVDFVINKLKKSKTVRHVIVQQLPLSPESFIHLDMVFTMLDTHAFLIYDPVIFNRHAFQTVHITLDNGKIKKIREVENLPAVLAELNIAGELIRCGGKSDLWIQEREQWHSGANFFAVAPGKIIGYQRNIYTLENLADAGFEVIPAGDIISGKSQLDNYKKCVITIEGSELSRGGGGCRCMTLPVSRESLEF